MIGKSLESIKGCGHDLCNPICAWHASGLQSDRISRLTRPTFSVRFGKDNERAGQS